MCPMTQTLSFSAYHVPWWRRSRSAANCGRVATAAGFADGRFELTLAEGNTRRPGVYCSRYCAIYDRGKFLQLADGYAPYDASAWGEADLFYRAWKNGWFTIQQPQNRLVVAEREKPFTGHERMGGPAGLGCRYRFTF